MSAKKKPASSGSANAISSGKKKVAPIQAYSEKAADLITEEGFRKWLQENKPSEQADPVVKAIRSTERYAKRNHMRSVKMFDAMPGSLRFSVTRLSVNNAFIKDNARLYKEFRYAAALLTEYAESLSRPVQVENGSASAPVASLVSTPVQEKGKKTEDETMEPSLLALIGGERFSALRNALNKKGIRTLESFRRLNLWVFIMVPWDRTTNDNLMVNMV